MAKETKTATAVEGTIVDRVLNEGRIVRDESQRPYAIQLISEYATQVLDEGMPVGKHSTISGIKQRIAQIDKMISDQVNEILHDPAYQALESAWRGLSYLVQNTETSTSLKLKLLNATKKELLADIEKASEFDQSGLFKKIYEEEYGTLGGSPFSCLVGDYEFGRHPQDIQLLTGLSSIAASAHAPLLTAASPKLMDMDSWTELSGPRDLSKIFESSELIKWRSFRESEDSRYVALTLPRTLGRLPYGPATVPVEEFDFTEDTDGSDHAKYLWTNSSYSLATRITAAFAKHKWCAAIRGVEGGGLVEGLPAHTFLTDEGDIALKCPTEISITDRREGELNNLGFIALCHRKNSDQAAFFGGQTANKPKMYDTDAANANARTSAMLPYILAASRFAHYFKAMMRDKIGSFQSRESVADYLNRWLSGYVLLDDVAPQATKAKYPLREGRVDVVEIPGRPGAYRAVAFLRPHFQLDELTISIRLVAELPEAAG